MTVVQLRQETPGLLVIAPEGAPLVTDAAPELDVLVLEVVGGHLSWGLLGGELVPAAVLDDVDAAQDWVWAVFGEQVALAVAESYPQALTASPARLELVTALRRLAYGLWVNRWWPASTIDGIPALDPHLLLEEIEALAQECEMALDPAALDAELSNSAEGWNGDGEAGLIHVGGESRGRAEDYALAAGGADPADGLIVARGIGGWDWRRCPPGMLDAGENSVSWQVARTGGVSTVRISVVAAPDCRDAVPEHLRPFARVGAQPPGQPTGHDRTGLVSTGVEIPLYLRGDAWTGSAQLAGQPETPLDVTVFVPGVGPADLVDESATRDRIRRFARLRLSSPSDDPPLAAESAAASSDEDF